MNYNQFSQALDTISKMINWNYKTILAPHIPDSEFIKDSDHPFSHEIKLKKQKNKKMTMQDVMSLKSQL